MGVRGSVSWFVEDLGPEGSDRRRRGRFFVVGCFSLAVMAVPLCLLNYQSEGRVSSSVTAFLVGIPLMALNPFLLRRFGAPAVLAIVASVELLAALAVMTYAHGGVDSAATVWFAAIPFLAGVWAGHRVATGVAVIALGTVTGLFILQWNGHAFPRPLSDEAMLAWKFGGIAGSIAFIAAMVYLYERQTSTELADRADQLAFRQRLIRGIVDSSLDAVIAFTGDGTIRSWDGSAEKIFGWKREQVFGKNLFQLLTSDTKRSTTHDGLLRRLQETRAQRVFSERTELDAMSKKGRRVPVEMSISPAIQIDDTTLYTAFIRDLTKVRRGRERVKRLRHDLNQVIEQTPDGMVLLHGTELVFANDAWQSWFGDGEAVESNPYGIAALAVGEDRDRFADHLARATTAGAPMHLGEFQFSAVDDQVITLDVHYVPDVKVRGVESTLLVARDVTEQQIMRERLAISDRMATMGTLLAGVAHEINNPLTYVIGNLGVIEMALDERTDESIQHATQALKEADEGAMRIVEIVRDMQRLCTDDDGVPEAIDPAVPIRSALKIAENKTKYVATVRTELADVPPVLASVSRIGQVVLNLVVNAAQAFGDKDPNANEICVRTGMTDSHVYIEVEDNASGIAADAIDKIFDPFYTTKPPGEGTGLGLWISQKIVEGLGGELLVESHAGLGTRFRILLTRAHAPRKSAPTMWARGSRTHKLDKPSNDAALEALKLDPTPERAPSPEFADFEPTPTPPPGTGN